MMEMTAKEAAEKMQTEARFRQIALGCVAFAMDQHGQVNPERADAEAYDIAVLATATLLQKIYTDDAELNSLRAMNAHLEKLVKEIPLNAPQPFLVKAPDTPR